MVIAEVIPLPFGRFFRFYDFVAGVECEIAKCEWPDGRPKQGQVQEAAREVRYLPSILLYPLSNLMLLG